MSVARRRRLLHQLCIMRVPLFSYGYSLCREMPRMRSASRDMWYCCFAAEAAGLLRRHFKQGLRHAPASPSACR